MAQYNVSSLTSFWLVDANSGTLLNPSLSLSPGLMITSALLYHVLHFFHITIDIRNVCVFLAPLFSSFTAIVTYHFTKELKVENIIYATINFIMVINS